MSFQRNDSEWRLQPRPHCRRGGCRHQNVDVQGRKHWLHFGGSRMEKRQFKQADPLRRGGRRVRRTFSPFDQERHQTVPGRRPTFLRFGSFCRAPTQSHAVRSYATAFYYDTGIVACSLRRARHLFQRRSQHRPCHQPWYLHPIQSECQWLLAILAVLGWVQRNDLQIAGVAQCQEPIVSSIWMLAPGRRAHAKTLRKVVECYFQVGRGVNEMIG